MLIPFVAKRSYRSSEICKEPYYDIMFMLISFLDIISNSNSPRIRHLSTIHLLDRSMFSTYFSAMMQKHNKGGMILPRKARTVSNTGIYHVMIRGNNKQDIFFDTEDRLFFLKVIRECKQTMEFELYAYCLMSNHVHMLIKPTSEPIDRIYKKIGTRYVIWFNRKYDRVGHLFQDRFKSENVETERYFLTVLRYIIQNPRKADIEKTFGSYRWNCWHDYAGCEDNSIIDRYFAINVAGSEESLISYLQQQNSDTALEMSEHENKLSDTAAIDVMRKITGCNSAVEYKSADKSTRKNQIDQMLDAGVSVKQIADFTGLSASSVYRIK